MLFLKIVLRIELRVLYISVGHSTTGLYPQLILLSAFYSGHTVSFTGEFVLTVPLRWISGLFVCLAFILQCQDLA